MTEPSPRLTEQERREALIGALEALYTRLCHFTGLLVDPNVRPVMQVARDVLMAEHTQVLLDAGCTCPKGPRHYQAVGPCLGCRVYPIESVAADSAESVYQPDDPGGAA